MNREMQERVKTWRAHPNYGKWCECSHHAITHAAGEHACTYPDCSCQEFHAVSANQNAGAGAPIATQTRIDSSSASGRGDHGGIARESSELSGPTTRKPQP